jgi:hypothetical protein
MMNEPNRKQVEDVRRGSAPEGDTASAGTDPPLSRDRTPVFGEPHPCRTITPGQNIYLVYAN